MLFFHLFLALVGALPILAASPFTASRVKANSIRADMATSQNKGNRLVFCHFMVGRHILGSYHGSTANISRSVS